MIDAFEKVSIIIHSSNKQASKEIAQEIADLIKSRAKEGKTCVLGMATGSTPKTLYAELVRLHREEGLSFKNVVSFNLDEYFPMKPDAPQSYHRFMHSSLFSHVDIDPKIFISQTEQSQNRTSTNMQKTMKKRLMMPVELISKFWV